MNKQNPEHPSGGGSLHPLGRPTTLREVKPPQYNDGSTPSETPCPSCGGPMTRGPIACPDGRPGCCVLHYGQRCSRCGKQWQWVSCAGHRFMRKIYCPECGKVRPTHPDDAALGFFPRRTHGQVINELVCDACGKVMPEGSDAVAESVPRDMGRWEGDYLRCPNIGIDG